MPMETTPLHSYKILTQSNISLALLLGVSSGAAIYGVTNKQLPAYQRAIWCIPQQFLVALSSFGAFDAVISSSYPDGVQRSFVFILADQLPAIVLIAVHTIGIIDLAGAFGTRLDN